VKRPEHRIARATESTAEPSALDRFLTQPDFVEDGKMEEAHVRDEQLHGEQRVRFAITRALATGHEHGGGRA
jgi:ABC-type sulfate/molybdate transport systems ATPase subunit